MSEALNPSPSGRSAAFTTSDGATIAYTLHERGVGDGPRLVLVHSLALDRSVWDTVIARLHNHADIVALDCRGHGQSSRRAEPFTAELFARDAAELLDHLQWPRAAVAGCSMGGCVALALGGLYPDRVQALGLIDTTAWYGEGAPARFRERADAARAKGMDGMVEFQLTRWFSDAYRAATPPAMAHAVEVFLANDFDCYAATCGLLGDADLRAHLPRLRMPVAIVVGEEDYATPVAMAEFLHAQIPHSTLTVLPQARHLTPIEHPGPIAAELAALLAR